jgi:radical SAM superfamily enzyme YgiQ (UPF0313 family)
MHDLETIRSRFGSPRSRTRIAFVHNSFQSVEMRKRNPGQLFAGRFPALGLLNLAHSLRTDAAAGRIELPEMRYFDQDTYADLDDLHAAVARWLADAARPVVAVSSYTMTIARLESFLRKFDPGRYLIVAGGAHASVAPDIANVHIVCRGEGGAAMRHIVAHAFDEEFGTGSDARGLNYVSDGQMIRSKQAFDQSLSVLPAPAFAYDLIDPGHSYVTHATRLVAGDRPQIYVCTQSCRARCTFCSTYLIHGRTVARPVAQIEGDLNHLIEHFHTDAIEFHDDDILQHPELEDLLALLTRLGLPWFCYARVETIDDSVAAAMAAAGCRRVFLGIESMSQQKLDYFNKGTTVDQNRVAVTALAEHGVGTVAGFIVGAPDDTHRSIASELDALLSLPLYGVSCSILTPDPGTVEFQRVRRRRPAFKAVYGGDTSLRVVPDTERFGMLEPYGLPTICNNISKVQLNAWQTFVKARFYLRSHVWRKWAENAGSALWPLVVDHFDHHEEHVHRLQGAWRRVVPEPMVTELVRDYDDFVSARRSGR